MILIRLPDGRITAVEEADVAGAVEAGAEVVDRAVKTKFGRETTESAAGPEIGGYIDPVAEETAAIRAERLRSYEDENITAFAQGATESLTAGLVDFNSEDAQLREQVNPIASTAGQVTGLVGGALLGAGAPGLAAKAGATAASGIKSTVGRFAAEAAVDGLTYATMREGIGAVVHDKPFSVEAIAAETLLSGGVGAALGVGVKGAGALRKALSKDDVAREAIRSVGSADPGVAKIEYTPQAGQLKESMPGGAWDTATPTPPAPPKGVSDFVDSLDHVKFLDKTFKSEMSAVDTLMRDMAETSSITPQYLEAERMWPLVKESQERLAKLIGLERATTVSAKGRTVLKKVKLANGKEITGYIVPDTVFSDMVKSNIRMGASESVRGDVIAEYAKLRTLAAEMSQKMKGLREAGDIFQHTDISPYRRVSPPGDPYTPGLSELDTYRAARYDADSSLRASVKRAGQDDIDSTIRRIMGAEKKLGGPSSANIDEVLSVPAEQRAALLDSMSQADIDSLAEQVRKHPKIISTRAKSSDFVPLDLGDALQRARSSKPTPDDIIGAVRADRAASVDAIDNAPTPPRSASTAALDAMPSKEAGGDGVINMLHKTNMLTMAASFMFPKVMAAKAVIQKYGAKLASAAESAMSNRTVQMVSRKAPVIAWAKIMAPDGDDRDRNLRAVQAISQSPEAWGAAVDEALANINPDSPTQRIEARERIQAQLGYLVQNAPSSLSPLRPVWSPSSIAHFNRLIDAWQDPLGVLANVKTAPSEQLNAVREMWPESYSEFMARLVDQVSTYAAEGKTIPRDIGRLLPMASASWSVSGMQTLQSMQTQPVEMDQSGKFNAQTAAPTTVSESLSSNRINLNR